MDFYFPARLNHNCPVPSWINKTCHDWTHGWVMDQIPLALQICFLGMLAWCSMGEKDLEKWQKDTGGGNPTWDRGRKKLGRCWRNYLKGVAVQVLCTEKWISSLGLFMEGLGVGEVEFQKNLHQADMAEFCLPSKLAFLGKLDIPYRSLLRNLLSDGAPRSSCCCNSTCFCSSCPSPSHSTPKTSPGQDILTQICIKKDFLSWSNSLIFYFKPLNPAQPFQ